MRSDIILVYDTSLWNFSNRECSYFYGYLDSSSKIKFPRTVFQNARIFRMRKLLLSFRGTTARIIKPADLRECVISGRCNFVRPMITEFQLLYQLVSSGIGCRQSVLVKNLSLRNTFWIKHLKCGEKKYIFPNLRGFTCFVVRIWSISSGKNVIFMIVHYFCDHHHHE